MKFRELRTDEVECRVGTCSEKGVQLLLYKTARVDADILDEAVGSDGWQCEFYECKGTLFCKVGILVERKDGFAEWVWKDDAGAPSNMEAEKGEASDAFKRACFKWGIGRELYSTPFIWVPASKLERHSPGKNGKWQCYDRWDVKAIEYEGGRIAGLEIANGKGTAYSWRERAQKAPTSQPETPRAEETPKRDNSALNDLVKRIAAQNGTKVSDEAKRVVEVYGDPKEKSDAAYKALLFALEAELRNGSEE